jgi:Flp pilus assembly protein TadB
MSKNRYGKMQGNMQYNRPSGGYQKNLYRQQMLANNVKRPQTLTQKTLRIILIVAGVLWAALTVFLTVKMKWTGLLIGMVVLLLLTGCLWLYLRYTQKQMIKYYKQIGMTEEMYVAELRKRNTDVKQIKAARKLWNKVQAEPIIDNPKGKKKK